MNWGYVFTILWLVLYLWNVFGCIVGWFENRRLRKKRLIQEETFNRAYLTLSHKYGANYFDEEIDFLPIPDNERDFIKMLVLYLQENKTVSIDKTEHYSPPPFGFYSPTMGGGYAHRIKDGVDITIRLRKRK